MERWLPETIGSVKSQSLTDWECIIVDDGSTDGSESIARSLVAEDDRFQIISQENKGVAHARNTGIAASHGKYLLLLDSDDLISPDYLQLAVKTLEEHPDLNLVYGKAERFGTRKDWNDLPAFDMGTMLERNCLYVSCVFRRADYDLTDGFDPSFSTGFEDWDFWLSLAEAAGGTLNVHCLQQTCFYYRTRRGSRNSLIDRNNMQEVRKKLWEKHKPLYSLHFPDPLESVEYQYLKRSFDKAARWSLVWKLRLLYRRLSR